LGQVIVSPTLCSLCQACEKACPIGAIEIFNGFVYVCDLCGGKPKCVAACTEGAITSVDGGQEAVSLAEYTKQAKKLNPGERRALYLKKAGLEARKRWRKKFA
jgi:carbon-monoxide dehydrogenase iron sulfur subunit